MKTVVPDIVEVHVILSVMYSVIIHVLASAKALVQNSVQLDVVVIVPMGARILVKIIVIKLVVILVILEDAALIVEVLAVAHVHRDVAVLVIHIVYHVVVAV